jgi:hypothetical protein
MSKWGDEKEQYMLEKLGETDKGYWFNDGVSPEDFFLPSSVITIVTKKDDMWEVEVPNWLAKQKGLI